MIDHEHPQNEAVAFVTEQKPSRRRLGYWLLIPLMASVIAVFIFSIQWKSSLHIKSIEVVGTRIVSKVEIITIAKSGIGKNASMYDTDIEKIQETIMASQFIKSAIVTRQMPDKLSIVVEEREPIATLNTGRQIFHVDEDGTLLPYIQSAVPLDLPVISGIGGIDQVQVGEIATSNDIYQAIELLKTAQRIDTSLYKFISEINMNAGNDVTLYSVDIGVPIIFGRGDITKKLLMLQSFWSTIMKSEDPKELRCVDLRFEDQVVVKWNHATEQFPKKAAL